MTRLIYGTAGEYLRVILSTLRRKVLEYASRTRFTRVGLQIEAISGASYQLPTSLTNERAERERLIDRFFIINQSCREVAILAISHETT